jgi:hypothetical protein
VPGKGAAEAEDRAKVEDRVKARAADPMDRVSAETSPAPGRVPPGERAREDPGWEPRIVRVMRFLLMMGTLQAW